MKMCADLDPMGGMIVRIVLVPSLAPIRLTFSPAADRHRRHHLLVPNHVLPIRAARRKIGTARVPPAHHLQGDDVQRRDREAGYGQSVSRALPPFFHYHGRIHSLIDCRASDFSPTCTLAERTGTQSLPPLSLSRFVFHLACLFSQDYFVEVDVVMPASTELWRAHDLAQRLQDKIELLPNVERAFVHVDHETEHRPVGAFSFFILFFWVGWLSFFPIRLFGLFILWLFTLYNSFMH